MELQLETIIHSVEDAILSVDDHSTVVFLNNAAARMFGCLRTAAWTAVAKNTGYGRSGKP